MPWCKDSCRFVSCALKCPGYPLFGLTTKLVRIYTGSWDEGCSSLAEIARRPLFCDGYKLSQRNKRPYVAGIYHYPPRRGGSVADRWDRVCLPEQDWAFGVETDSLLGAGIGGCGQHRRGGRGGPYRVQLGHRRGMGDAGGGGVRDQHDLVHAQNRSDNEGLDRRKDLAV